MAIKLGIKMEIVTELIGPAIQFPTGELYWYLNNKYYGYNNDFTTHSWSKFVKTLIFSY